MCFASHDLLFVFLVFPLLPLLVAGRIPPDVPPFFFLSFFSLPFLIPSYPVPSLMQLQLKETFTPGTTLATMVQQNASWDFWEPRFRNIVDDLMKQVGSKAIQNLQCYSVGSKATVNLQCYSDFG